MALILTLFFNSILQLKCIKCKKQEQHFNNEKWCINKQYFFKLFQYAGHGSSQQILSRHLIYDLKSNPHLLILT